MADEQDVNDTPAESGNDSVVEAGEKLLASLGEAANRPFDTTDSAPEIDEDSDSDEPEDDEESEEDAEATDSEESDETKPAEEQPAESGKEDEPEAQAIVVKLPGQKERGEKALEIEVEDPEVAERLRRLAKDGMRAATFEKESAKLREERAELDDIKTHLAVAPERWIIDNLNDERKLSVAKALLADLYDNEELQEEFSVLADETTRRERKLDLRERNTEAEKEVEAARAKRDYARSVLDAVVALVPEGLDRATHQRFLADAERDLVDEVGRGTRVTPHNVKELLDYRLRMYGFGKGNGKKENRNAEKARPASEAARRLAESTPQDRRKNAIVRRRNAAAAGTPGAGAIASRPPAAPKGSDIETASAHALASLKKQGGGDTWQSTG